MVTPTKFHEMIRYYGEAVFNFTSDTLKIGLSNSAPVAATNTVWADITEITAENGYSAGGSALAGVTWTETGGGTGVWRLNASDLVFTASGGSFGPFRYVVCYDDTPASPTDPLLVFWDYGSSITVTDGNTFTVDIQANGILELS